MNAIFIACNSFVGFQGTKKFNFAACPSGKLQPRCTSLEVISTSPKIFNVLQCSC